MATTTPPARPTAPTGEDRLQLDDLMAIETAEGHDVVVGLTHQPKSLPPKYLYDQRGSELFELICDLPEYYPTRTETAILQRFSSQIAHITGGCELVELGSGSSTKTRYLFDAYQQAGLPLHYVPVDVSGDMLKASAQQLLGEYPTLSIHGLVSTYEPALTQLPSAQQPTRMIAKRTAQKCNHA
ncbi:MAG: L-histidine N(alpha)-methyltransferase, partial [Cyanobacteria bacterium J06627_15]